MIGRFSRARASLCRSSACRPFSSAPERFLLVNPIHIPGCNQEALSSAPARFLLVNPIHIPGRHQEIENTEPEAPGKRTAFEGDSILHQAAFTGHSSAVTRIAREDPSLVTFANEDLYTPLHRAASCSHYAASRALLEALEDSLRLEMAQESHEDEDTEEEGQGGSLKLNDKEDSAVDADADVDLNLVKEEDYEHLLKENEDDVAEDRDYDYDDEWEPNEWEGDYQEEVVELTLEQRQKITDYVNALNHRNQTSLHLACLKGYPPLVEMLLAYGADSSLRDSNGLLPLHIASKHGRAIVVRMLLETEQMGGTGDSLGEGNAAWVNSTSGSGVRETALHMAAKSGLSNTVKVLLEAGSDPTIESGAGVLPLDMARRTLRNKITKVNSMKSKANKKNSGEVREHTLRLLEESMTEFDKSKGGRINFSARYRYKSPTGRR